ncbi:hypothetical protein Naga_100016g11 [Nannochloropsis gaditana]|uniref:Uncharacterized protein n=1 Tax=Nannochloropsis gaditana TaxID=72520 RepID=W7TG73_9STRA|nr:hypothetical protein Naga_100016g11 [Nannochloropsis gaditana]
MPSEALKSVVVRCREILDTASVPSRSPKTLLFLNGNPELREYSDGIHFPESSLHLVPSMRTDRKRGSGQGPVMGASVHSVVRARKKREGRMEEVVSVENPVQIPLSMPLPIFISRRRP